MISKNQREFVDQIEMWMRAGVQAIHVAAGAQAAQAEHLIEEAYLRARSSAKNQPAVAGPRTVTWDTVNGLKGKAGDDGSETTKRLLDARPFTKAVETVISLTLTSDQAEVLGQDACVIFRDPHLFLRSNPDCLSVFKEAVKGNRFWSQTVNRDLKYRRFVIILTNSHALTEELSGYVSTIEMPLPVKEEIAPVLERLTASWPAAFKAEFAAGTKAHETVCQALTGLTTVDIENTLSEAVVRHRDVRVSADQRLELVRATIERQKADVLRRTEALQYIPLEDVLKAPELCGYETLDRWVVSRRAAYSEQAGELKIDRPKGLAITGIPGCVDGDTEVSYCRGKRVGAGDRKIRIEDMYRRLNGLDSHYKWNPELETRVHSYDAETGKVFLNRVVDVYDKGVKACLRVTTETGRVVGRTHDHPVLMEDGTFTPAGELEAGDVLLVRGDMKPRPAENPVPRVKRKRVVVEGLKYHPTAWEKKALEPTSGKTYVYGRTHRARLVFEAHMNGIAYDELVRILKEDPIRAEMLRYLPAGEEVHHINEDPTDDRIDNLMLLLKADHARLHCDEERFNVEYTTKDTVVSIEPAGERRTYDLSMEMPAANFALANGLIVHNSGKSVALKLIAKRLQKPLVMFDIASVFGSLVGESERKMREALAAVTAMQDCVLGVDEIDKALGGAHEASGDSGVTKRVLGKFLSWLADKDNNVFVVFTMNRIEQLPPELTRRGRLDEIFWVDLPSADTRLAILRLHLQRRGVSPDAYSAADWEAIAQATDGFVGAELEDVVKAARLEALLSGSPKAVPTTAQILDVARKVQPLSKTDDTGLEKIREFSKTRAVPVGEPSVVKVRKAKAGRGLDVGPAVDPSNYN